MSDKDFPQAHRIAAIVPIKTNNLRLPGKNTRLLGNKPLYAHLLDRLKTDRDLFSAIYVDSSDQEILRIARAYDFIPLPRPESLNGPETSGNDLLSFEMEHVREPIIAQLFVTLPFLEIDSVRKAAELLRARPDVDSVVPAYRVFDRFWCDGKPVNHDPSRLVGTQFMKPLHREAGYYVFRREAFLQERSRVTRRHALLEMDERQCVDIDTDFDFFYAEQLLRHKNARS